MVLCAGLCVVMCAYATRSDEQLLFAQLAKLLPSAPADLLKYINRILCSAIFLGAIPLVVIKLAGLRLSDIGFTVPRSRSPSRLLFILALCGAGAGAISSQIGPLKTFYPYARSLITYAADYGLWIALPHVGVYFLFYYVSWEIFFRGILILPLIGELEEPHSSRPSGSVIAIAGLQALPSALLHFGHPISEIIGAIFFGVCAGYFVVKTKSILPSLIFHASVGITLDLCIIIQAVN